MWFAVACAVACGAAAADIFFSQKRLAVLTPLAKALVVRVASLPVIACVLAVHGLPQITSNFWLYVALNAALDTVASFFLMRALTVSPISQTQPLLAATPVFMIATTPLLTGDAVTAIGLIGVGAVSLGVYATQHPGRDAATGKLAGFWSPFAAVARDQGARSMLAAAAIFSVTRNVDRLCIDASSGPFYLFVEHSMIGAMLGVALVFQKKTALPPKRVESPPVPQPTPMILLLGGSICAVGFLLHVWALELTSVPYLIAVKRLSIIATSLWGYFVRKERAPSWYRLVGVFLAVGGVVLIVLYGKA